MSVYPLSRYLRAFDAAVVAAGYNSYHEMVMAGVPAAYVPNLATTTDDQLARAEHAAVGRVRSERAGRHAAIRG